MLAYIIIPGINNEMKRVYEENYQTVQTDIQKMLNALILELCRFGASHLQFIQYYTLSF